jgi:hypothetical protein
MGPGMHPTATRGPEFERAPKQSFKLGLLVVAGAIVISVIVNDVPGAIQNVGRVISGEINQTPTPAQTTTRTPVPDRSTNNKSNVIK